MSVDAAQIDAPPALDTTPPVPAKEPNLADALLSGMVQQHVAQAVDALGVQLQGKANAAATVALAGVEDNLKQLHIVNAEKISEVSGDVEELRGAVKSFVASNAPAVGAQAVVAVKGTLANAQHDTLIPRIIVGAGCAAILMWLAFYLTGSPRAASIWEWVVGPGAVLVFGGGGRMLLATAKGTTPKAPAS